MGRQGINDLPFIGLLLFCCYCFVMSSDHAMYFPGDYLLFIPACYVCRVHVVGVVLEDQPESQVQR